MSAARKQASSPETKSQEAAEPARPQLNDMQRQFLAARRVSTPLVAVQTPDPAQAIRDLYSAAVGAEEAPALVWDIARGLRPLDKASKAAYDAIVAPLVKNGSDPAMFTTNPGDTLGLLAAAPKLTMIFMHNAHRLLNASEQGNEAVVQATWNLRDEYRVDGRTLVLLGPSFALRPELAQDVLVLDEELPDADALRGIVTETYRAAGFDDPPGEQLERAVDALRGLAAFPAEQVTAMSMRTQGVDVERLWERKRKTIEQTRGLGVDRDRTTFADVGGLEAAKEFGRRILAGGARPRVVVRIDEIEKMLGGAAGDTSGVSQDALGVILREMEDQGWTGIIAVGPAGSGKSVFSKALGGEGGVPTLTLDLGAAKGSLVGESEAAIRQALKVIRAVAGDGAFFVATCNKLDVLPPELRRRFRLGTWFFDLPTAEERESIWRVALAKYKLSPDAERPVDEGWTGAEIRNACDLAWRLGVSPREAGAYVVPVSVADPEGVERLRRTASGRFLSAAKAGTYTHVSTSALPPEGGPQVVGVVVATGVPAASPSDPRPRRRVVPGSDDEDLN